MSTIKTPARLAASGASLWEKVTGTYDLRADELRLLEDACREADLIDQLDEALDASTLMIFGSQGQQVINPLVSEIRQHRAGLKALMAALKLPEDGDAARQADDRSTKARAAANARWATRGA